MRLAGRPECGHGSDAKFLGRLGRLGWGLSVMSVTVEERSASVAELPLLLTVEEAAAVLRIGRTLAYSMAHRYEETGGADGLPVIRLGNCLRVPRWALLVLVCTGHVVALLELAAETAELFRRLEDEPPVHLSEERPQLAGVQQSASPTEAPKRAERSASRVAGVVHPGQQLVLLPPD